MKWRVKILYAAVVLLFLSAVAALAVLTFSVPEKGKNKPAALSPKAIFAAWSKEAPRATAERRTTLTGSEKLQTAARPGYDELTRKIYSTANDIVLATLPPGSVFAADSSLQLQDNNCAVVSGTAATPGTKNFPEKRFRCRVRVYFLANGSCEAAFPEFSEINWP